MVMVDQDCVGRLDGGLAHEPAADVLQLPGCDAVDALAHGGKTEIRAVGDERGEQRAVWIRSAGFVAAERLKGVGEAAPRVDILQHVFDARPRQARLYGRAKLPHRRRDRQRVGFLQLQPSILDRGETVGAQAHGRVAGGPVERGCDPVEKGARRGGEIEPAIGVAAGLLPAPLVIDEIPERDVLAALR